MTLSAPENLFLKDAIWSLERARQKCVCLIKQLTTIAPDLGGDMTQIFLINVGANSAHRSKARCPLFPDGSFIYVPFPLEDNRVENWPYPAKAWPFTNNLLWHQTHVDPDWPQLTYGDNCLNPRASALKSAAPNDILLFWSLLWDNTGDSWFDFTERQSWHLIGASALKKS